jgi:hypothetical protein
MREQWRLIPNGDKSAMLYEKRKLAFSIPTSSSSPKNRNTSSSAATALSNPTLSREKEQQVEGNEGLADLNRTMPIFNYRLGHALATFAGKGGSKCVDYTKESMGDAGVCSSKEGSSSSKPLDDLDGSVRSGKTPPQEEELASHKKGCWLEVLGTGIRLWRVPPLKYSKRAHNLEEWSFAMQSVLLAFKYILDVAKV